MSSFINLVTPSGCFFFVPMGALMIDSEVKRRAWCTHLEGVFRETSDTVVQGTCPVLPTFFRLLHFHFCFCLSHLFLFSFPFLQKNSTYSSPSVVEPTKKSPNRSLRCSSHPLVPICVAINHHSVCCSVTGSVSPSAPDDQSCSTSAGSSASAAFGLFPFPLLFRCFLAAFSA